MNKRYLSLVFLSSAIVSFMASALEFDVRCNGAEGKQHVSLSDNATYKDLKRGFAKACGVKKSNVKHVQLAGNSSLSRRDLSSNEQISECHQELLKNCFSPVVGFKNC